jgi:anthranilate synthase/aminodeoxychorismate synthase-like glutamine amidotransferase
MIKTCQGKIPVLGVCLGHQCIAEVYGGKTVRARSGPMHGKISRIMHQGRGVFKGLNSGFSATRYHSLAVEEETLPSCLAVTAKSEDGEIMGLCHKQYSIEGVQFHPESVLTELGMELFKNFLEQSKELL